MVGKNIPKKEGFTGKKMSTSDLYMKDGKPAGDIQAVGPSGKGPSGQGGGPRVGGYDMGIHNGYANGVPNAGKQDISATVMSPAHKANVTKSVLDTKEDGTWGGVIAPQDMAANNKIGV